MMTSEAAPSLRPQAGTATDGPGRGQIVKPQLTGWAAIIAVPTFITGYFGMNVPYPGFGEKAGFAASIATIVLTGLVLYLIFKRKDWL